MHDYIDPHLGIYNIWVRNLPSLGYSEHSPASFVKLCENGIKRKINVYIKKHVQNVLKKLEQLKQKEEK